LIGRSLNEGVAISALPWRVTRILDAVSHHVSWHEGRVFALAQSAIRMPMTTVQRILGKPSRKLPRPYVINAPSATEEELIRARHVLPLLKHEYDELAWQALTLTRELQSAITTEKHKRLAGLGGDL